MKTLSFILLFCLGIANSGPADGLEGAFPTPNAKTVGHGHLLTGLSLFGHNDVDAVKNHSFLFDSSGTLLDTAVITDLVSFGARPTLSFGIGKYFDATLSIPIYSDIISETNAKDLSGTAQGDLQSSIKIGAPLHSEVVALALDIVGIFNTGVTKGFLPKGSELVRPVDSANGLGTNEMTFSSKSQVQAAWGLFSVDMTKLEESIPIRFGLGLGYLHNPSFLGGARAMGNFSLEYLPVPRLGIFVLLSTQTSLPKFQGFDDFQKEDLRLKTGLAVRSEEGLFVDAGIQLNLSGKTYFPYSKPFVGKTARYEALATPGMQISVRIGWTGSLFQTDIDADGISDKDDPCPKIKEDMDGFQDADGCPDPDNDEDSLRDEQDKCPLQAEDIDNIQDDDGCPEIDADSDGIYDEDDKCQTEAEDRDGVSDMDGCPDLDNDQDNILDAQDRCPVVKEDKDDFQDEDGCPDPDNDKDGILDSLDKCPMEPENRNGVQDMDGCPDAAAPVAPVEIAYRAILSTVQFQGQTATLTFGSYPALDSLAAKLKVLTHVRIEIRVYSDDRGTTREQLRLTQTRAEAVTKYLVLKGVEPIRIPPRGMGAKEPITSNRTAQGRAQNRRVEFQRLD